jgi:hypothetical protein
MAPVYPQMPCMLQLRSTTLPGWDLALVALLRGTGNRVADSTTRRLGDAVDGSAVEPVYPSEGSYLAR